jgi:hypothetical protein
MICNVIVYISSSSHSFSSRKSFRVGKQSKLFCPIDEIQNCSGCDNDKILSFALKIFTFFPYDDRVTSLSSVKISTRYTTLNNYEKFVK